MIVRALPLGEWDRLQHTELGPALPLLHPASTTILVVEDTEGTIIGCWALLHIAHAEGVWIAESHRKRGRVAAALWSGMAALVAEQGGHGVMTAARTPEVARLLDRRGGIKLDDVTHYLLPLTPTSKRHRRSADAKRGAVFHQQLFAHQTPHADDPTHDEAVGRALREAIAEEDPEGATIRYNHWAREHGYLQIRYCGMDGDVHVIDFGNGTIIGVDAQYRVTIRQELAICQQ